ncbi:hypothetical protein EDD15DRAFT_2205037 [Pisolithus albus]|nr:hypothetical protein EDD15DRAFT_2205037 [Pisolithus albus]
MPVVTLLLLMFFVRFRKCQSEDGVVGGTGGEPLGLVSTGTGRALAEGTRRTTGRSPSPLQRSGYSKSDEDNRVDEMLYRPTGRGVRENASALGIGHWDGYRSSTIQSVHLQCGKSS